MRQRTSTHRAIATTLQARDKVSWSGKSARAAIHASTIFALGLSATAVHAVAILTGSPTVATPGTTCAARPVLAGIVKYDKLIPFSVTGPGGAVLKGQIQDRAVLEKAGNYSFYHRIILDAATNTRIAVTQWNGFSGCQTDGDWRKDGLGTIPTLNANRYTDATVQFFFVINPQHGEPTLTAGTQSRFHFVRTNATGYNVNGHTTIWAVHPVTNEVVSVDLPTVAPTGSKVSIP